MSAAPQLVDLFEDEPLMHVTVMQNEVVQALMIPATRDGGLYVDCTCGGGGHTMALLQADPKARVIACDRDRDALAFARGRLTEAGVIQRARLVQLPFGELNEWLEEEGVEQVDGITADLGISSLQLDSADRGLSFRFEGPLDMRMDRSSGETALELIERLGQEELADVIYQLGEERRSRRVARCIKQAQAAGELETTLDLRKAVVRAVGPRRIGGVDPATRTFQALRIAVNDELGQLESILETAARRLAPGGLAAFISFHSLEDRLVKRAFMNRERWERLTKKPMLPSDEERAENPRARSAKLRVARRLPELLETDADEPVEEDIDV